MTAVDSMVAVPSTTTTLLATVPPMTASPRMTTTLRTACPGASV